MSKTSSTKIVENESELEHWLEKSSKVLILFDVHLNWTGRCETLIPQLDALYRTIDQSDDRLKFLSLEVPKFAEKFKSIVELSPSCSTHSSSLDESSNNNAGNDNDECLDLNLLMKKNSCSPLFLAVLGCKVISIVRGANFPALFKVIQEHLPNVSDDDIVEET